VRRSMKTTAICRFDGTAVLLWNGLVKHEFSDMEELRKMCRENNIEIEIEHWHPASGLRMKRNGNG